MTVQIQPSILVVDDDDALRSLLVEYLTGHGLSVTAVGTAKDAVHAVAKSSFNLVLLDLSLPDGDGLELARQWREKQTMSIICLTGRSEEADRVMGLELGADDYITKPFSLREVLARIRAVSRRTHVAAQELAATPEQLKHGSVQAPVTRGKHPRAYQFAAWSLNLNTRRLTSPDKKLVSLTNAEFNLLVVFLGTPETIVTREQLLERTRAFDDVYDRTIDVQILRLRRKLEVDAKNPLLLCTERGVGYYLNTAVTALWE